MIARGQSIQKIQILHKYKKPVSLPGIHMRYNFQYVFVRLTRKPS